MPAWEDLIQRCPFTCPIGGWQPTSIASAVEAIFTGSSGTVVRSEIGQSFEGRPITLFTAGSGPKRALLWSQMHGDEYTHTTVLLNLLQLLHQQDPLVARLTSGLTLGMILPLNPDGAELGIRQNAQGIDANRDAQRFATPEANALRRAFEEFAPDYGFNLHNQNRFSAMGSPPVPASVSVEVPPLDPENTQSESVLEANRVAATFCERVRDHVEGRLSRYPADFMPRAMGEWAQRQNVSTMLIEAGAWPGGGVKPLEQVHFAALVQTLEAIAASALGEPGGIEASDPASYLDLPRSSGLPMYDLLVNPTWVAQLPVNSDTPKLTKAELGINYPGRMLSSDPLAGGTIAGIGDLALNGAIRTDEASGTALPGRIVLAEPSDNAFDEAPADWETLIAKGTTTALIPVNLADDRFEARLARLQQETLPINAAIVLTCDADQLDSEKLTHRLSSALFSGVAATIGDLPKAVVEACCHAGVPALDATTTPTRTGPVPSTLAEWLIETRRVATQLGWTDCGRVGLQLPADVVIATVAEASELKIQSVDSVYVGGAVVRDHAGLRAESPGRWR